MVRLNSTNGLHHIFRFSQPPTFGILEGENAFQDWKAGASGRWLHHQNTPNGSYVFTAPTRSEYHFVFYTSRNWIHAKGQASFQVEAVTYSVSRASDHCPAGSKSFCVFPLSPKMDAYLLFVAPPLGDSYTMSYSTKARNETYAGLFASLSSAVGLCIGVALIAWCGGCGMICGGRRRGEYEEISDAASASTANPSHDPPYNPAFGAESEAGRQGPSAPPPYSVLDPSLVTQL